MYEYGTLKPEVIGRRGRGQRERENNRSYEPDLVHCMYI
jgi:hypothetical protein